MVKAKTRTINQGGVDLFLLSLLLAVGGCKSGVDGGRMRPIYGRGVRRYADRSERSERSGQKKQAELVPRWSNA